MLPLLYLSIVKSLLGKHSPLPLYVAFILDGYREEFTLTSCIYKLSEYSMCLSVNGFFNLSAALKISDYRAQG